MIAGWWLAHAALASEVPHDRPGEPVPDRHWDAIHLDLHVTIDPIARTVTGETRHRLVPLGAPWSQVRLHQESLTIDEVRVDDQVVEGWRVGKSTLDVPVSPGVEHVVSVRYHATPQTGLHFREPKGTADPVVEVWSQGEDIDNRHWFPSWDHPSDKFTVRTEVTAPTGMVAVANGVAVGQEPASPGWTRWTYALDRPIVNYLVAVAVGDYTVVRDDGPVPLEYLGARTHDAATIRRGVEAAKPQMAFFAELLDEPYPYPVYRQVLVSRFLYGGMENASLTILSDGLLTPAPDPLSPWVDEVVAHELAHQWFGDLLTCYGWRELWLNEGFAEFYAGRWGEHAHGDVFYAEQVDGWMRHALELQTPMAPRGWSAVPGTDNDGVYERGAAVLHMLRVMLGDDVFDAGIRTYVDRHADRLVESDDLRRALEDVSGVHLGWFFDQWVHGVGVPSLASGWTWSEGELVVTVSQTTEGAAFWAPVDIEVGVGDRVTVHRGWIGDGELRVVVATEVAPDWVAVDPRSGVLARWERKQERAQWIAQATRSPSPGARLAALRELGVAPDDGAGVATLAAVLADPSADRAYRRRAARSLGSLSTDDATTALLGQLDAEDPQLRLAVVEALGETERAPATLQALERRLDRDPFAELRGRAVQAIAELDEDRGLSLARRALSQPDRSAGMRIQDHALGVLGTAGEAADLALLLDRTDARWPHGIRSGAAWAAAQLVDRLGKDDRAWLAKARSRATERLVPWLDDPDQRTREAAIWLLTSLGDDHAEDALQRFATENEVPGLSERARDAANAIRGRVDGGEDDEAAPDEDLERLEESIDDLRARLERLESWRF